MPKIRTTIEPDRVVEVDDKELSILTFDGLLLEVVQDGRTEPPTVNPPARKPTPARDSDESATK